MERNIQDYIQYYIGCDFYLTNRNIKTKITNYWPFQDGNNEFCVAYGVDGDNGVEDIRYIKPILRQINNVTDDEWLEFEKQITNVYDKGYLKNVFCHTLSAGENMHWRHINNALIILRKNHIDVDLLIKDGLAIDASTLTK